MARGPDTDAPTWSFNAIHGGAETTSRKTADSSTQPGTEQEKKSKNRLTYRFEKLLVHPTEIRLIALCPTLDLVAVATGERQFECFRFDGHRAFWYKKSTTATIKGLSWVQTPSSEPTARSSSNVCVAWSDGKLDFLTSGGERLMETNYHSRISVQEHETHGMSAREVTCFATAVNQVDWKPDGRHSKQHSDPNPNERTSRKTKQMDGNDLGWGGQCASKSDHKTSDSLSDLPLQLGLIDLLEELPPLGALTVGAEDSLLTDLVLLSSSSCSQTILDTLVNKKGPSTSETAISMMLLCSASGYVNCILNNGFNASRWQLIEAENVRSMRILSHATHQTSLCQAFLIKNAENENKSSRNGASLILNLLSVGILRHPASFVPLVLHTSDILVKLSQYITQTVIDLRQTVKAWQRLPGRFIENITETLLENGSGLDLRAALYRLAVTGNCPALVKDWLADQIGPMVRRFEFVCYTAYS